MATILALQVLYDLSSVDLKSRDEDIDIQFGWRKPARQQLSPKRIVWVPGDESGSLGKELGATKAPITGGPNGAARNLADLDEFFNVQIQAHDTLCPDDELGQYTFTRLLYDMWRACVYRACHGEKRVGQVHIDSARWVINNTTEFRRGATIVVTARIRCPIPDDAHAWANPRIVKVTPGVGDLRAPDIDVSQTTESEATT